MNFKLISCEIFSNEINSLISASSHDIDVEYLPKGLHDIGHEKMHLKIQQTISSVDVEKKYDYILLGYGLCNNGTIGLSSKNTPVVIPRIHDCIALLMGSKEKYSESFASNPGTFYLSPGWIDHAEVDRESSIQSQLSMNKTYEELVEEYGRDNAEYLYETLCEQTSNYSRIIYIKNNLDSDSMYEKNAREQACEKGWKFDVFDGDLSFMQRFLNGKWDDSEFIIIPPGKQILNTYNENIFKY